MEAGNASVADCQHRAVPLPCLRTVCLEGRLGKKGSGVRLEPGLAAPPPVVSAGRESPTGECCGCTNGQTRTAGEKKPAALQETKSRPDR